MCSLSLSLSLSQYFIVPLSFHWKEVLHSFSLVDLNASRSELHCTLGLFLGKIRVNWTQALQYLYSWSNNQKRATNWLRAGSEFGMDTLDKGMIQVLGGWSETAWDFSMLLRMTSNLNLINYVFLEFPFNFLNSDWPWVSCGEQNHR
jgi:hypothetical protein